MIYMRAPGIVALFLSLWWVGSAKFMDDSALQLTVLREIAKQEKQGFSVQQRSLAIYFLDQTNPDNSPDVIENNVKLFASVVSAHNEKAVHQAFYIFSVVGGADHSLSRFLPTNASNTALISAPKSHNDLLAHVHTVTLLGDNVVAKFGTVLFLNQDARGPFEDRSNGKWWQRIVSVFQQNPTVGIVGPMISCEISPHVQTHAFAMRSEVALKVLHEFNPKRAAGKKNKNRHLETSISEETINMGHAITSLYYQRKFNRTIFTGECEVNTGNSAFHRSNPTSWCGVSPQDALFLRFGGAPLRIKGYYCQDTLQQIAQTTEKIALAEPAAQLVMPETIYGGHFYPLYKEYNAELWRDRSVELVLPPVSSSPSAVPERKVKLNKRKGKKILDYTNSESEIADSSSFEKADSKVCLLVRTSLMHGEAVLSKTKVELTGPKQLVQSLLRQSTPDWEAYFFVTDDQPFDEELKSILGRFKDIRLKFLDIDKKFRPKYTVRDAGYTATDEALRYVQNQTQCKWLSVTNGDNLYGSDVFLNILNTKVQPGHKAIPDVILSPLDSRNYADQDYSRKRVAMGKVPDSWELRCGFLESELARVRYGYAMTPFPNVGGLDLAGLFMDRKKFIETGVYFSAFADPSQYPCPGCQDGYFITDMVTKHKWSLHRAPILQFSSLIFHGPSPLWCIAGGNVWYDHPGKTACLSHRQVGSLHPDDRYDWESYLQFHGSRVCLRMSKKGYANMAEIIIE